MPSAPYPKLWGFQAARSSQFCRAFTVAFHQAVTCIWDCSDPFSPTSVLWHLSVVFLVVMLCSFLWIPAGICLMWTEHRNFSKSISEHQMPLKVWKGLSVSDFARAFQIHCRINRSGKQLTDLFYCCGSQTTFCFTGSFLHEVLFNLGVLLHEKGLDWVNQQSFLRT